MKELCEWINPECLVISCCTKKCDVVNKELKKRFEDCINIEYEIIYNEMLENHCCPICGNNIFYYSLPFLNKCFLDCMDCFVRIILLYDDNNKLYKLIHLRPLYQSSQPIHSFITKQLIVERTSTLKEILNNLRRYKRND